MTRHETDDGVTHRLTAAGYRAAGRKPPRGAKRSAAASCLRASAPARLSLTPRSCNDHRRVPLQRSARLGLRLPHHPRTPPSDAGTGLNAAPVTKRTLFLGLLARETGASLAEIVAATGWLPHTSRAALSRLRSTGQPLAKTTRADGCTAYRLVPAEAVALKLRRTSRAKQAEAGDGATLQRCC